MIENQLAALGLDEKERKFYLAALQLGSASVTEIASKAGLSRTLGYDLVARLESRGLVSQVGGERAMKVVVEDPSVLLLHWERTRSILDNVVPELKSLFNASPFKPRIRFYDGEDGIRKVLWGTLETSSKTLLGILSMNELLETPGKAGMQEYIAERIRRGIHLRVIRSSQHETDADWPSSSEQFRELRYAPKDVDLGMTMYVYDNKVCYLSSRQENYALVIESKELATLNRNLFEGLWASSQVA